MHLLDRYSDLAHQKNQKASITLGVTETRIRALRYEAKLKFPPEDKNFLKINLLWCLAQSRFETDKNRIIFAVEDSYVRHGLQGLLKEHGAFADNSFNSELVSVSAEHLGLLLDIIYGKHTGEVFRQEFEKVKKKDSPAQWKEVLKEVVKHGAGALGSAIPPAIAMYLGVPWPKGGG
jgi:hypothetical protein